MRKFPRSGVLTILGLSFLLAGYGGRAEATDQRTISPQETGYRETDGEVLPGGEAPGGASLAQLDSSGVETTTGGRNPHQEPTKGGAGENQDDPGFLYLVHRHLCQIDEFMDENQDDLGFLFLVFLLLKGVLAIVVNVLYFVIGMLGH